MISPCTHAEPGPGCRLVRQLSLTRDGEWTFTGTMRGGRTAPGRSFGGGLIAQALLAAGETVTVRGLAPGSLHAYFVSPGDVSAPVRYTVTTVGEGQSWALRQIMAEQDGTVKLAMHASFRRFVGGGGGGSGSGGSGGSRSGSGGGSSTVSSSEHQRPAPPVRLVPPDLNVTIPRSGYMSEMSGAVFAPDISGLPYVPELGPHSGAASAARAAPAAPADSAASADSAARGDAAAPAAPRSTPAPAGSRDAAAPTASGAAGCACTGGVHLPACGLDVVDAPEPERPEPGTAPGAHRATWMRVQHDLDELPLWHAALLAYASDIGTLRVVDRPHKGEPGTRRAASVDHAMWFHREFRFDDWLWYGQRSPVLTGGRGMFEGSFYDGAGRLVASCAQEVALRRVTPRRPLS